MHSLFIKLEKLHSEPILVPFQYKNLETNIWSYGLIWFSHRHIIFVKFRSLGYSNFMQKIRKIPCINFWSTWKTSFLTHFGPIFKLKKLQIKIFPKKAISNNFDSSCNWKKKKRKVLRVIKLENFILHPFWPLSTSKSYNKIF